MPTQRVLCSRINPTSRFTNVLGVKGWESLKKTLDYIPKKYFHHCRCQNGVILEIRQNIMLITFFEHYDFDSVTVAPYMGKDSVSPFLGFKQKWAILLALTSKPGCSRFSIE